jgi:hypothetical protein
VDERVDRLLVAVLVPAADVRQEERGPTHALHAAGHGHARVPGLDALGRQHDRLQPAAAHLVDGIRGDGVRQPGEQGRLPGRGLADTGLHHVAHHHFVHLLGVDAGPLDRLGDGDRPELRGRQVGQPAEELADRGADGGQEEHVHTFSPQGAQRGRGEELL